MWNDLCYLLTWAICYHGQKSSNSNPDCVFLELWDFVIGIPHRLCIIKWTLLYLWCWTTGPGCIVHCCQLFCLSADYRLSFYELNSQYWEVFLALVVLLLSSIFWSCPAFRFNILRALKSHTLSMRHLFQEVYMLIRHTCHFSRWEIIYFATQKWLHPNLKNYLWL